MIIINIKGGLGNQMFQYALYSVLRAYRDDVMISTIDFEFAQTGLYKGIPEHGATFILKDIFDVECNIASHDVVQKYVYMDNNMITRVLRHYKINKKGYFAEQQMEDRSLNALLGLKNAFLDGYWQRFSYYEHMQEEIRRIFKFKKTLEGRNAELAREIGCTNSVSLHVRRGDYLKNSLYAIQTEDYYLDAIEYIKKRVVAPRFYCFSDDIEWCENRFGALGMEFTYIDWNKGKDAYIDMQLMSMCRHNIITNSSFSVWGAWLNNNSEKIVVRPRHYYTNKDKDDSYEWGYPYLLTKDEAL